MDIPENVRATLTDSDKQELEIWEELLSSRGYQLLQRFLEEKLGTVKAQIENAPNWDSYVFARGQRDVMLTVIELDRFIEGVILNEHKETEVVTEEENYSDESVEELEINLGLTA